MVSSKRVQWLGFFFSSIILAGCAELAIPDDGESVTPQLSKV